MEQATSSIGEITSVNATGVTADTCMTLHTRCICIQQPDVPGTINPHPLLLASCSLLLPLFSLNVAALSMFGYAKTDLIGCNVSTIMPEPFATSHNSFMLNYVLTGTGVRAGLFGGAKPLHIQDAFTEGVQRVRMGIVCLDIPLLSLFNPPPLSLPRQTVLRMTRTVFAKHKHGWIFPVALCVFPTEKTFVGRLPYC